MSLKASYLSDRFWSGVCKCVADDFGLVDAFRESHGLGLRVSKCVAGDFWLVDALVNNCFCSCETLGKNIWTFANLEPGGSSQQQRNGIPGTGRAMTKLSEVAASSIIPKLLFMLEKIDVCRGGGFVE
jgi:hypothetical protein